MSVELIVDERLPYYVVEIRPEVMLDDEGIVTWGGPLAGPFATFAEAEHALTRCDTSEERARLGIYQTVEQVLSIPDETL